LGKEAEDFSEFFRATIRFGDDEGRAAKFVGEIGGDKGFGDILQSGKANKVGIGTQFGQRAFQCREAKKRFETFTDCRKNHYFLQIYSTVRGRFQRICGQRTVPAKNRWGNLCPCAAALIGLECEGGVESAAPREGLDEDTLEQDR
jgi:hypothetical protein